MYINIDLFDNFVNTQASYSWIETTIISLDVITNMTVTNLIVLCAAQQILKNVTPKNWKNDR